jgi:predicted PurR-regulated permease PerM
MAARQSGERAMAVEDQLVRVRNLPLIVIALVAAGFGLWAAQTVFMPVFFALFAIGLTAPAMRWLQPRTGGVLAVLLSVLLAVIVVLLFVLVIAWGAGRIAAWAIENLVRLEGAYRALDEWLGQFDIGMAYLLPDQFDPAWVINPVLGAFNQFGSIANFLLLVFVFVALGLTELEGTGRRIARIEATRPGLVIRTVAARASADFGRYMRVRLLISALDGLLCYVFFRLVGLDEPEAWAVLVFALNFIPFIGPLIAAIAIGFFSAAQFGDLGMVALLVGVTTLINFGMGSFVEPLVAGSRLKMSAFLVLFSVFLWFLIWGIPGAFIGVQITIVTLIVLRENPRTAWLADLLSGASD